MVDLKKSLGALAYHISQTGTADKQDAETVLRAEARISELEAALRAAVPEGEPYAYEFGRSNGDGTYSVHIERQLPAKPHSDWPVRKLYTHPAPRPDMERDLAEARAEIERLKYERDVWRSKSNMHQKSAVGRTIAEAERDALAADKARLEEDITRKDEALEHARHLMWTYGFSENNLQPIRLALSGASIPAPDKAEARREGADPIEEHLAERNRRDTIARAISNPARREGEA